METVSRRGAIGLFSAAGMATILGRPGGPAAAADKAEQTDLFVLGPFQVGDWFQAKPTKVFDLTDAPTVPELIKALNRTRVYLIDGRKERLFADRFPLIAVEGDLKHQWAKGKRSWELHVVGVTGPVSATDNSAALPKREIGALAVALWAREKDDEQVVRESLSYFSRRNVRYDITGTLRDS